LCDEQNAAALATGVADRLQRAMQQRHGLGRSMMWMLLRAPKMKSAIFGFQRCDCDQVNASFQELTHRESGSAIVQFSGWFSGNV